MKLRLLFLIFFSASPTFLIAQGVPVADQRVQAIHNLIDRYSRARTTGNIELLENILTPDIDQLVSSGEWRKGIGGSILGMVTSSPNGSGSMTLKVENIRFLSRDVALVDARYRVLNSEGVPRDMWSSFSVVYAKGLWKISAIRNMLPAP